MTLFYLVWILFGSSCLTDFMKHFDFDCSLTLPIFPLAAFAVEKLAQQKYISDPVSPTVQGQ